MANSSKNGLTGVDGQLKRLLVKFSEAVFLAQPPPKDIHKFAEEYFTKLWNRAKLNMPTIGTEVCVVDPVEDKPDRVGKVVAVNRIANTLDVMFPDGSREGGVPREYTSTETRDLDLSAYESKSAAELQRELSRPVPGFRALTVAFVVNVAKLEHPPGDVRKYAAEYFKTLREVNSRTHAQIIKENEARLNRRKENSGDGVAAEGTAKSIAELTKAYSPYKKQNSGRPMSPAVAESLEKGQHGWFVEENAKLSTKKFEAWAADTPEGRDFMDLASQQFAAERQVRIREVHVKRQNAQVPLCVNLAHVAILPLFRAVKKSFLRVEDCFEADAFGSRGPVEVAGVGRGDVIIALNGHPVESYASFMAAVARNPNFRLDVFSPILQLDEVTSDLARKSILKLVHADSLSMAHVLFEWQKLQKNDAGAAREVEKYVIELQRKFRDGTLARMGL